MRRTVWGGVVALATMAACTGILLVVRPHLSVATPALVLVVPAVLGVSIGGFAVGFVAALVGFVAYDVFFIPPYGRLAVAEPQDWVALVVYVLVVLVVARLVAIEQDARRRAADREMGIRQLFVVSEHLIGEQSLDELLSLVVETVHESFTTRWVAVLLPDGDGDGLGIAATAGSFGDADRVAALGRSGRAQALALTSSERDVRRVALTALQRPVGQLVVAGASLDEHERRLLGAFANQAAFAIERAQLRSSALRTELLEEVDRWRSALVGAVSHDLRTPLASIKAAVTTLRESPAPLTTDDRSELLVTIESQCDRLTRLVANVLDMARLDAGTLVLHREPHAVSDVVAEAVGSTGAALEAHRLVVDVDPALPLVEVDLVLIAQVLANLLTNAAQHAPEHTAITVAARAEAGTVVLSVSDEGPGVPPAERERIFHMLDRRAGSGRAGLGLAISSAFVGAHGQRLAVRDAPGGGACFEFGVPVASVREEVPA